jgi:hypothetical protein
MAPIRAILQTLANSYAKRMAKDPLPPLYESGIVFRPEPWAGSGTEDWASPYTAIQRGWGDCDDLVVYRAAELIAQGEPATIVATWLAGTKKHHVLIRRGFPATKYLKKWPGPKGVPNNNLEDPSLVLIGLERERNGS